MAGRASWRRTRRAHTRRADEAVAQGEAEGLDRRRGPVAAANLREGQAMNETDDQRRGSDGPPRVPPEHEGVVMGEILKGAVTGLRDGAGIEIDGRVVV